MTLTEIHYRLEYLLKTLQQHSEDQDLWFNCQLEIAYLKKLKKQLEEDFQN